MSNIDVGKIVQGWSEAKHYRARLDIDWSDAFAFCYPGGDQSNERAAAIVLGRRYAQYLAGAIASSTVSRTSPWFSLRLSGEIDEEESEAQQWLTSAAHGIHLALSTSGFYAAVQHTILHAVICGNGVMYSTYRDGKLVHESVNPMYCWWDIDRTTRKVIYMYRLVKLSPVAMIKTFGEDAVHPTIKDAAAQNESRQYEVLHYVWRREDVAEDIAPATPPEEMPWGSVWIDVEHQHVLKVSGYPVMPYTVLHFWQGEDAYGTGPGVDALPTLRELAAGDTLVLKGASLLLQPPTFVPPSLYRDVNISLDAGAINPYDPTEGEPWIYTPNPQGIVAGENILQTRAEDLRGIFMIDLFLTLNNTSQMTATEASERAAEKARMMASILLRIESELYAQIIETALDLMMYYRNQLIPQVSETMGELDYTVLFESGSVSLLRRAEEAELLNCIFTFAQIKEVAAKAPEIEDMLDMDMLLRRMLEARQLPPGVVRTAAEAEKIRAQRAATEAQATAAQAAMSMVKPIDPVRAPEPGSLAEQMLAGGKGIGNNEFS